MTRDPAFKQPKSSIELELAFFAASGSSSPSIEGGRLARGGKTEVGGGLADEVAGGLGLPLLFPLVLVLILDLNLDLVLLLLLLGSGLCDESPSV